VVFFKKKKKTNSNRNQEDNSVRLYINDWCKFEFIFQE